MTQNDSGTFPCGCVVENAVVTQPCAECEADTTPDSDGELEDDQERTLEQAVDEADRMLDQEKDA